MIYVKLGVFLAENSYSTASWNTGRIVTLDDLNLSGIKSSMFRKGP
jgi:hypothetical protein